MVEQLTNKTLLITGGTGFIGSHTIVEILDQQLGFDRIVIIDNLSNSNTVVLERIEQITGKTLGKQFFFESVDIRQRKELNDVFVKYAPIHSVIHFAGLKAVGESVSKPLTYYDNNVGGTMVLLELMHAHKTNNIVFSSSATVYGDNPLAKEGDPIFPTNPYG